MRPLNVPVPATLTATYLVPMLRSRAQRPRTFPAPSPIVDRGALPSSSGTTSDAGSSTMEREPHTLYAIDGNYLVNLWRKASVSPFCKRTGGSFAAGHGGDCEGWPERPEAARSAARVSPAPPDEVFVPARQGMWEDDQAQLTEMAGGQ